MTPTEARQIADDTMRSRSAVAHALRTMADRVEALEAQNARLLEERDVAFAMTHCECGADEACANLVRAHKELAEARLQYVATFGQMEENTRLRAELAALKMVHIYAGSCPDDMIKCWRINYGLDKRSPEDAMRWWHDSFNGLAPAGAVAALGLCLLEIERLKKLKGID